MISRFLFLFAIACAPAAQAISPTSDVICDDSVRLTHQLANVMGAERQGGGLRDPETLLEVWINRKNGDWVVVQNYSNGTACIVAMGEYWESSPKGPA